MCFSRKCDDIRTQLKWSIFLICKKINVSKLCSLYHVSNWRNIFMLMAGLEPTKSWLRAGAYLDPKWVYTRDEFQVTIVGGYRPMDFYIHLINLLLNYTFNWLKHDCFLEFRWALIERSKYNNLQINNNTHYIWKKTPTHLQQLDVQCRLIYRRFVDN